MTLPTPKPPTADGNPPEYNAMKDLAERCAAADKSISLASAKVLEWMSKEQVQRERAMKAETELERVQKQVVTMREALRIAQASLHSESDDIYREAVAAIRSALQPDAGSDYIRRDEAYVARDFAEAELECVKAQAAAMREAIKQAHEALTEFASLYEDHRTTATIELLSKLFQPNSGHNDTFTNGGNDACDPEYKPKILRSARSNSVSPPNKQQK